MSCGNRLGCPRIAFDSPHRQNMVLAPNALPGLMELLRTQLQFVPPTARPAAAFRQPLAEWPTPARRRMAWTRNAHPGAVQPVARMRSLSKLARRIFRPCLKSISGGAGPPHPANSGQRSSGRWRERQRRALALYALPGGETSALVCPDCGYAAEETATQFQRDGCGNHSPASPGESVHPALSNHRIAGGVFRNHCCPNCQSGLSDRRCRTPAPNA